MTAVEDRVDEEPTKHGNFFVPRAAGIGSLGWVGSAIAAVGAIVSILAVATAGLVAMLFVLVVTGAVLALLLFRDQHGRNLAQRIGNRLAYRHAARAGTNRYAAGPLSPLPFGACTLPGLAAQTELTEWVDSWEQPFVLLDTPSTGTVSTVWSADPPGSQLIDQSDLNQMVANLGGWLDGHTQEDRLVGASITVETRGDSGHRLRAAVEPRRAVSAPGIAVAAVSESLRTMSVGGSSIRGYATATFSTDDPDGGRRQTPAEMAAELASRLPLIGDALRPTGAGVVRPTTGQELCEVIRSAYDQEAAALIEEAHADGEAIPLSWSQVGPISHHARWREYQHDDGLSVTWVMSRPPKGTITASALARVLSPHPAVAVKRVTLHYRPWDLGQAAERVEHDVSNAAFAVNNPTRGRPSAQARKQLDRAQKTADEEAEGAGLHNFTVVITATVTDPKKLRDARAVIKSLSKGARLLMREAHGGHDSAFLFGLPLGLVPGRHAPTPEMLKERL